MGGSSTRRRPFAERLSRNARAWGLELSETVEFHFRRRYNLSPTDPRFLDAGQDDMLIDWWAHRFLDDPRLKDEVVNPDFDAEIAALERAAAADGDDGSAGWDEIAADHYE